MDHDKSVGFGPVTQDWTHNIPLMQQTVLLTAIRGPDGIEKYSSIKFLLRWYRRCVLLSAMDKRVLPDPFEKNGGSFTGPSIDIDRIEFTHDHEDGPIRWQPHMDQIVDAYLKSLDAVPHHFQLHFLHAAEIVGYKHPDPAIASWWKQLYNRLVNDMHLHPESEEELDERLGDCRSGWLKRADPATTN